MTIVRIAENFSFFLSFFFFLCQITIRTIGELTSSTKVDITNEEKKETCTEVTMHLFNLHVIRRKWESRLEILELNWFSDDWLQFRCNDNE